MTLKHLNLNKKANKYINNGHYNYKLTKIKKKFNKVHHFNL